MKKILWSGVIFLALGLAYWTWQGIEERTVVYQDGYPDLRGQHIVVYVSCRDEVGKAFLELFKDKTGCSYEYLKMTTPEALARIRAEREHPKADIFIGGTCDAHILAKEEGLTEKYVSKNYDMVAGRYKDRDGYWIGIGTSPLSIIVNKERWEKEYQSKGLSLPQSYEDLLNPAYRGEVIVSDPNTSGTAYTMLAYLNQRMGSEMTLDFLHRLKANVGEFTINGYTPAQKVAAGEYLFGVNFLNDQLCVLESGFAVLTIIPPQCGWSMDAVSKIKKGPNKAVGRYFIDFCTTKEIQEEVSRISFSMPIRSDAEAGPNLGQFDIYEEFDFIKASRDRAHLLQVWNDSV